MNSTLASLLVTVVSALSLTACSTGGVETGDIHDSETNAESNSLSDGTGKDDPAEHAGVSAESGVTEPNGVHLTQAAACEALLDAQVSEAADRECAITTRPCPSLIQALTGIQCAEYDEGSVQGCLDVYHQAKTCEDLDDVMKDCQPVSFPADKDTICK